MPENIRKRKFRVAVEEVTTSHLEGALCCIMSEVTFYDDFSRERIMTFPEYDRTKLKLDLNPNMALSPMKRKYLSPAQNAILQSPDLKLLKLASPELEKLIIQGNGLLTTPTPTGAGGAGDVITEEQEQFARGFIEALQKLQNKEDVTHSSGHISTTSQSISARSTSTAGVFPSASSNFSAGQRSSTSKSRSNSKPRVGHGVRFISTPRTASSLVAGTASSNTINSSNSLASSSTSQQQSGAQFAGQRVAATSINTVATTSSSKLSHPPSYLPVVTQQQQASSGPTSSDPSLFVYTSTADSSIAHIDSLGSNPVIKTEEGLQIVPSGALNVPPIDLELQERVKHQRKKLRNRLAAQRCRKRKIEREDELKDRVKDLKSQESDLKNIARDLRAQVCELKQKVLQHVNGGCRVIAPGQTQDN